MIIIPATRKRPSPPKVNAPLSFPGEFDTRIAQNKPQIAAQKKAKGRGSNNIFTNKM